MQKRNLNDATPAEKRTVFMLKPKAQAKNYTSVTQHETS